jgi:hypothetical protein
VGVEKACSIGCLAQNLATGQSRTALFLSLRQKAERPCLARLCGEQTIVLFLQTRRLSLPTQNAGLIVARLVASRLGPSLTRSNGAEVGIAATAGSDQELVWTDCAAQRVGA